MIQDPAGLGLEFGGNRFEALCTGYKIWTGIGRGYLGPSPGGLGRVRQVTAWVVAGSSIQVSIIRSGLKVSAASKAASVKCCSTLEKSSKRQQQ